MVFAIPIERVLEVIEDYDVTPLFKVTPGLRGLINLRGQVLATMDISQELGFEPRRLDEHNQFIVLQGDGTELALCVDEILGIQQLLPARIQKADTVLSGDITRYVHGVLETDNGTLMILSVPDIFDSPQLQPYQRQQDDEDVLAQLYRHNHVLAGFASILGLPKVAHVLAILDFVFDYARQIETFEQHSMDYVVQLLIDTIQEVFDDFKADSRCGRNLSDVIEECKTYLRTPFQECLVPPQPPPTESPSPEAAAVVAQEQVAADDPQVTASGAPRPSTLPRPQPVAVAGELEVDDEPEDLDIPVDKVGLVSDFCEECRENLAQIGYRLVELEDSEAPMPLVNDLFRSVHTVKGGARLMKIHKMETLSHQLESLLDQVRTGARAVSADLIDVLLDAKTLLEHMVDEVASRGPIRTRIAPTLQALAALQAGITPTSKAQPAAPPPASPGLPMAAAAGEPTTPAPTEARPKAALGTESIRIPTDKLDDVLNTASEVFITRIRLQ